MAFIIKGTTPSITYTFKTVRVADIQTAVLTMKKDDVTIVERNLDTATAGTNSLTWKLTQQETLNGLSGALMMINYVLTDGTRGASAKTPVQFEDNQKEEVL